MEYFIRALYKFDNLLDRYADAFRRQSAKAVDFVDPEIFDDANSEVPICDALSFQTVLVPEFTNSATSSMQDIPIEGFTYEQRSFGYTVSVWLRNYG